MDLASGSDSFSAACSRSCRGDLPALVGPSGENLFRKVKSGTLGTMTKGRPALKEDISGIIYRLGFMGMLNIFKEISKENSSYPEKRWQAFTASSGLKLCEWTAAYEGDPAQNLASISVKSVTTSVLQQAAKRVDIPKALRVVLRKTPDSETPYKELYVQLKLVAEVSGMSAIRQMYTYAAGLTNLAIVVSTAVLDEAESFKARYLDLQTRHGEDFPFLTILDSASLMPLTAANYPDLYFVSVEPAKSSQNLNTAFQTSQHPTPTAKDTLRKWVKKSIVGVGVSEDRKRRLEVLGINPEK